jgi:hypothetical protein
VQGLSQRLAILLREIGRTQSFMYRLVRVRKMLACNFAIVREKSATIGLEPLRVELDEYNASVTA